MPLAPAGNKTPIMEALATAIQFHQVEGWQRVQVEHVPSQIGLGKRLSERDCNCSFMFYERVTVSIQYNTRFRAIKYINISY